MAGPWSDSAKQATGSPRGGSLRAARTEWSLVPSAFFLSVLSPHATTPSGIIFLAYVGAVLLAVGVLVLGVGLVRRPAQRS